MPKPSQLSIDGSLKSYTQTPDGGLEDELEHVISFDGMVSKFTCMLTASVMHIDIAARLHSIQIGDDDDFPEEPHVRFEDIPDDSIPAEVSFDDPTAGDILSVCIAFGGTLRRFHK
jgi:hypothetical protein